MKHILILMVFVFGCAGNLEEFKQQTDNQLAFHSAEIMKLKHGKATNKHVHDMYITQDELRNAYDRLYVKMNNMGKRLDGFENIQIVKQYGDFFYVVQDGDCLWYIADKYLGDPTKWILIYKSNDIADPDLIYPGQELLIEDDFDGNTGARTVCICACWLLIRITKFQKLDKMNKENETTNNSKPMAYDTLLGTVLLTN